MTPRESKQLERYLSLFLLLLVAAWDAYCQVHTLPYHAPWWLVGVILTPFGEDAYIITTKIPGAIRRLLKG